MKIKHNKLYYILILTVCIGLNCNAQKNQQQLDTQVILQKSTKTYDPDNRWLVANLKIHIQEPRLSNPYRYSILKMNNTDNSFELKRNRGKHISTHIIDEKGVSRTLLDGEINTDSIQIKKYRLQPERNLNYQKFYQHLIGLPMSLNNVTVDTFGKTSKAIFNDTDSYKIELVLKEAIFSKHWNVFVSQKDYTLLGIEIVFPDDPAKGERLYFSGNITIDGVKTPRIRHWHEYDTDAYSGSDIIVKEIVKNK
ncbi:hypothetical protein ATE84_1914 [Aquimarina sp. MAR_2010_214]|uniref:DUF6503 family protein n=1 Tax=Aquimarina sp. MAR_2010_214 TaxID=1250026 RepID=UPI000C700126|nr:DUF6503 family protein [Aquimarina sp. MAR_2010_214]PKV49875.1 hypothetical protein ATE84_1914 [Aquimarina sp. MAR_2010_214]